MARSMKQLLPAPGDGSVKLVINVVNRRPNMKTMILAVLATSLMLTTGCSTCACHKPAATTASACDGSCCKDAAKCAACCGDAAGCAKCCKKS